MAHNVPVITGAAYWRRTLTDLLCAVKSVLYSTQKYCGIILLPFLPLLNANTHYYWDSIDWNDCPNFPENVHYSDYVDPNNDPIVPECVFYYLHYS
jgi:hypothetical protein